VPNDEKKKIIMNTDTEMGCFEFLFRIFRQATKKKPQNVIMEKQDLQHDITTHHVLNFL